jgi:PAS domain S-box-containing protein
MTTASNHRAARQEVCSRALMQSSAEAFFAISREGAITEVNALAATLTGCSPQELAGRPFSELFGDPAAARSGLATAFSQGRVTDLELTLSTGGRLTVSVNAGVFRDPSGGTAGLLASARDITRQKESENQLRSERLHGRALSEANTDALVATDLAGRITEVNRGAEVLTGRCRADLVGRLIGDLTTEPDRARDLVDVVLRTGHLSDIELTVPRPDGTAVVLACNASTFAGGDGEVQGLLAAGRDITQRKKLEELQNLRLHRARRLDEARTEFVSRVSHELRSPLTAILGYLELLRAGRAGPLNTEHQSVVSIIERNSQRLLAQIEDLLLVSRIEAGTLRLTMEPVCLARLVEGLAESFLPAIYAQGIESRLDLDPGAELDADRVQLERAVANLISNAIKFTPAGGHIDIAVKQDGDQVVLTVRDTGIGVPAGEQGQLFTRFFRSSLSSGPQTRGTGLGLFIVKQVIEAHGGTVTAESAPGAGTTFTVRLTAGTHAPATPPAGGASA